MYKPAQRQERINILIPKFWWLFEPIEWFEQAANFSSESSVYRPLRLIHVYGLFQVSIYERGAHVQMFELHIELSCQGQEKSHILYSDNRWKQSVLEVIDTTNLFKPSHRELCLKSIYTAIWLEFPPENPLTIYCLAGIAAFK